jgi:hypothetical protein
MELETMFPRLADGREAAKARKLQTDPANRRIASTIRRHERNVERKANCPAAPLHDIFCRQHNREHRMQDRETESPVETITQRKPWSVPRLIVSETRDAENTTGNGADSVGRIS